MRTIIFPLYWLGNWEAEMLNNLPKFTGTRGQVRFQTSAMWPPNPYSQLMYSIPPEPFTCERERDSPHICTFVAYEPSNQVWKLWELKKTTLGGISLPRLQHPAKMEHGHGSVPWWAGKLQTWDSEVLIDWTDMWLASSWTRRTRGILGAQTAGSAFDP